MERGRSVRSFVWHLWWILPLLALDVWLIRRWWPARRPQPEPQPEAVEPAPVPPPLWSRWVFPTEQTNWWGANAESVFQSTASGNPRSALFGSVRRGMRGGRLVPTFHEGVDVACLRRDAAGRPLDVVRAVADGRVAHINRVAGNSNYGLYVVLFHDDPIGPVYTLYAHLSRVEPRLHVGQRVTAGAVIGALGHTSSSPIPAARAHLHFEIGLVLNERFGQWFRAQKLKPDHGIGHGWNLVGVDPVAFARFVRDFPEKGMREFLETVPVAFEVVLSATTVPDYFRRYPLLWEGSWEPGSFVVSCSENGLPLRARSLSSGAAISERDTVVVNEDALGANGARLVEKRNGAWRLAEAGERWRSILLYPRAP